MTNSFDFVESMIDSIVAGNATPQDVVSSVLSRDSGVISFAEGETPHCPDCGSTNMEEGFVESEGGKRDALKCGDCGTLLLAEDYSGDKTDSDDEQLVESTIDENDPHCPVCNSDKLTSEVVESDGQEDVVLTCGDCHTRMVVVG